MPSRREFVQRSAIVGGAFAGLGSVSACASGGAASGTSQRSALESAVIPARGTASAIKQSVCRWCFNDMSVDDLAANAKRIGLHSVELIGPADFPTIKKHGLMCAMVSQAGTGGIPKGWNRVDNHSWLIPAYEERIAAVAAEKWPNVICFSGNRAGLGDDEGHENCAT
jgi:hydroxypyruvate isomerase